MAEDSSVIEQEQQTLRAEIHDTQADLAHKIEQLGDGLAETWQSASVAVSDTVEAAKATVATTVHAVEDVVHETTAAIGKAFNVAGHVRRHPWLMLGGALLLGLMAANLVGRRYR